MALTNDDLLSGSEAKHRDFANRTVLGNSDWAKAIRDQVRNLSRFASGVLISGPNGTGKELIARAVHAHSHRADKPFVPVDCASVVPELFPSHLFGQIEGAFTGARPALGCFRVADGGTLLFDEIDSLRPHMQAQLLRVLEERAIVPVGGVEPVPIDVRIIAATNRDLHQEVLAGRFRRDLYHRLNMIELKTIALKEHLDDIPELAHHFAIAFAQEHGLPETTVGAAARHLLRDHAWPGNVRELKNVLERLLLVNEGKILTPKTLQLLTSLLSDSSDSHADVAAKPLCGDHSCVGGHNMQQLVDNAMSAGETTSANGKEWLRLDDLERYHIQQTMEHALHNQTAASALLGITRRVLSRLLKKHGLDHSRSRSGRPADELAADELAADELAADELAADDRRTG